MKNIFFAAAASAVIFTACNMFTGCEVKAKHEIPDVHDVVMYEVNPRVFAADHSFNAVVEHMDEIHDLGVNVLWFMPIYEIGVENSVNSPYCIKDYCALNPEFGTPEEFGSMVDEAHKRGMSVILDWVANHTSWDSDWVGEHKDWYTQDSLGNVIHPAGTGWKDVADLNYDNPDMRLAMIDAMKYWVREFGVDGFRCDAADYVPFDFWKQAVDSLRAIPDCNLLLLAEGSRKDHFDAGFDMNYAWNYLSALRRVFRRDASVDVLFKADSLEYAGLAPDKVKLRFTTNHDEAARTHAVKEFGGERAAIAAFVATTFMHGGMLIYGSQEVGFPDGINFFGYVPVDWEANPSYRNEYKSLIEFYNAHPAIRKGTLTPCPDEDVVMFVREYENDRVFVAVNLRNRALTVDTAYGPLAFEPYEYVIKIL